MSDGQQVLWELLRGKDPDMVREDAHVEYVPDRSEYRIPSFTETVIVAPPWERIEGTGPISELLIDTHGDHFRLATLAYLVQANGIPPTGESVPPARTSGGRIYEEGAHKLPLPELARPYAEDKAGFLALGEKLGGYVTDSGDASVKLFPFPLVPITFVLWEKDEEFGEQVDIFFDTSSPGQFAPDVLWSIAVASVDLLLDLTKKQ
jgi:hypothetical protein